MDMDFDTSTLIVTLGQFSLDIVDHALLAVAGRLWEGLRDITPQGERMQQTIPPVEQLRRSRLSQDLVLIARSVRDAWEEDPGWKRRWSESIACSLATPSARATPFPSTFIAASWGNSSMRRM